MSPSDKSRLKHLLLAIGAATAVICIVVLFFFKNEIYRSAANTLIAVLMPFIYGAIIAYLLYPMCLRLEALLVKLFDRNHSGRHAGLFRAIACILSLVIFLAVLILLILAVLPGLINSISTVLNQLPYAMEQFTTWLEAHDSGGASHEIIEQIESITGKASTSFTDFLQSYVLPNLNSLVSNVTSSFRGVLNVVLNFGLGCIICVYLLCGWDRFKAQGKLVVYGIFPPRAADWIAGEIKFANSMISGFVHGKVLDCIIFGVISFIVLMITGMPYAVLISVIMGVTALIPFFGQFLGIIPSALLVLTVSLPKCVLFIILMVILLQIDGNIISPRIIGGKLGLSAFWILFAILTAGGLFGLPGMLLGVPIFAVLYDLIRRFILMKVRKHGKGGMADAYEKEYHEESGQP